MKILVRDDAGNEYDAVAPEGASIAYAVQQASKKLGFKVHHVETPPVPEDVGALKDALKHTQHMLEMEMKARQRAEDSLERETKRREEAEDQRDRSISDLHATKKKIVESEAAKEKASARASAAESALSFARVSLDSMTRSMEEADKRHTEMVRAAGEAHNRSLESETKAREESEKRCTALLEEMKKRPAAAPRPKGYVIDIEGVDSERPRRRARISAEDDS